jgi:hypothetical protein
MSTSTSTKAQAKWRAKVVEGGLDGTLHVVLPEEAVEVHLLPALAEPARGIGSSARIATAGRCPKRHRRPGGRSA